MKKYIIIAVAAATLGATAHAGWLNSEEEKQQRIHAEERLEQQQRATGDWQIVAFVLGLATVGTLMAGTIMGSRAKKVAIKNKEVPHEPEP